MAITFINETGEEKWNGSTNDLTAQFALLNWIGCVNPMQAYDDGWEEVKPLSQIGVNFDVLKDSRGTNYYRDAVVLDDGTYKDTISTLNGYAWTWPDYMGLVVHEILHGTARINKVAGSLAGNYIAEHPELNEDQRRLVRTIFEEAVIRKYIEGMAKLNPSLIIAGGSSGIDTSIRGGERAAFMLLIALYDEQNNDSDDEADPILGIADRSALATALTDMVPEADDICDAIPDPVFNGFWGWMDGQQDLFELAETVMSPLILDLDGDGVETLGQDFYIHFDHDKNGFAERTGWVGADDGLLVLDRNGNGRIDDGGELFGNHSGSGPTGPANGFAALAEFDSNRDGRIDASDTVFANLRVWKDANSNGLTDAGELLTLQQAGVGSLSLSYTAGETVDAQGNSHLQLGSYTTTQGATRQMTDVWFNRLLKKSGRENGFPAGQV
jgi:hypothetical protein